MSRVVSSSSTSRVAAVHALISRQCTTHSIRWGRAHLFCYTNTTHHHRVTLLQASNRCARLHHVARGELEQHERVVAVHALVVAVADRILPRLAEELARRACAMRTPMDLTCHKP